MVQSYGIFKYLTFSELNLDSKNKAQNPQNPQNQEQMPDPLNALTNLATQGSRNPMQSQMMSLGGGAMAGGNNPNANLQNLMHVCEIDQFSSRTEF